MRTKYIYRLFVFLLISGFKITTLSQTKPTDIKNLSVGADVILTGKVTKQNSSWNKDKSRIYTEVSVEVDEYLKGNNNNKTLVVTTPGGEVGEVGELYTHMPRFSKDEEVLLFVKKDTKDMSYKVLNGEDGKMTLYTDKKTGEKATSSNQKISTLKKEIKYYVEQQ
jgi:hypothetical protein